MVRRIAFIVFSFLAVSAFAQQQPKLMLPIGHAGWVISANFSPDGKKVVTSSWDKNVKLWDATSGTLLANLEGHEDWVYSATFSPDGKKIVTASKDFTAKLWDVETGALQTTLTGHSHKVYSSTFSPDSKKVLTASADNTSKLWDSETGELLASLVGHSKQIFSSFFSPNGKMILTASNDKTAKLWDVETGKLLASLNGHTDGVVFATFSSDSKKIVTASFDKTAKLWDAENRKPLITLEGHSKVVYSASFSPDGKKVVTASEDNTSKLWDAETGVLLVTLQGNKVDKEFWNDFRRKSLLSDMTGYVGFSKYACFSPDGKKVATASWSPTAKLWDVETGTLLMDINTGSSSSSSSSSSSTIFVNSVTFSSDGKKVLTTSWANAVKVWNAETGIRIINLGGHGAIIYTSTFSPDGKKVVTANYFMGFKLWDTEKGKLLSSFGRSSSNALSANFSPDGKKIVTSYSDNIPKIWDAEKGKMLIKLEGHSNSAKSSNFSRDGKKIITASNDSTAKIWDAEKGIILATIRGHSSSVISAAFSPDGKKIVTASDDQTAKIWDAEKGTMLVNLTGHTGRLSSAEFNPDGKKVLTSSWDKTAKLWDAEKGALLLNLLGHGKVVDFAAFSPDGKKIVTASDDNTAKIWDSETGTMLVSLEKHVSDLNYANFSPDGKKVMTASTDNTIKLWDVQTGKMLYTLLAVDSLDYLIYDEHYRYDGTEAARKLLYFVCGTEVIELDQLKDQLWVPNLAERIMKGEEINAPKLSDLDLCDFIPKVEEQEGPRGEYHFKITPRRGGLGQTVLYINGIEVKRFEIKQLIKQGSDYLLRVKQTEVDPFFVAGQENKVTVRAFTAKNDIGSRGASVVESVSEKKIEPPTLHAVVVGVSDYKGDALDLKFAAKDARDFGNALKTGATKLFNFDGTNRVNLYFAHTESDRSYFPDKGSLKKIFETIGTKAKPNDVLLIFFAGHGTMNPIDQQFYFLTADASAMANPEASGISTKELFDWIQPTKIKAQKRVLILDACNSGQVIKDIVKLGDNQQQYLAARNDNQGKFIKAIDKLNERSGLFILSASASDQSAYEMGRYNQGVLTYSLLKSIKEDPSIVDHNQFLNLSQWFDATEKIVEEIAKTSGARQTPQVVRTTNFSIGVVDDDVRSKIILPLEKPTFSNSNFQDEDLMTDNLGLNKLLDAELSDLSTRSVDSPITFYPGSTSENAYQLSGRYTVNDNDILLKVVIRHKNEIKQRLEVKGKKDQLQVLVKSVVEDALKLVQ